MDQEVIKEQSRDNYGFTLIELVVVIGIVGILVSILIPAFINYNNFISGIVCNDIPIENLFEVSMINTNNKISLK